jgi:hydroxypyruvate isomerase
MGADGFRLDFAPHLGFPTPETPLFRALAGSIAPDAHIALAAKHGFRCVQDPFAASRSVEEQARVGQAAKAAGLRLGCVVYAPIEVAFQPGWCAADATTRAALDADMEAAIEMARRIGSDYIAVFTGTDPARTRSEQRYAMTANLARLADRVADAGMKICIEAVDGNRLPHMLLHHLGDAMDIVRGVGHPAVRLIFDTAHVQAMDGDLLGNLDRSWDLIELIQLADHPGRGEPGTGELNFVTIIDEIERRGFSGPVELEHGWATPGVESEERYLRWLERWASSGERKLRDELPA